MNVNEVNAYFSFNKINGIGRKEPLHVEDFLNDLKDVFEWHKVTSIKNGYVGFNNENEFGITNADIDLSETEEEKYKHLNALAEITEEIYYATHEE